jgi:hypothetical protein
VPPFSSASAADWLEVVLPRLPACLAGRRSVANLRSLAGRLPGDGALVFETRLTPAGRTPRPVDLSLRVTSPSQAMALAQGAAADRDDPSATSPAAGWQCFLRTWAARPDWRAHAPSIWLEFDLRSAPPPAPVLPLAPLPQPILCARLAAGVAVEWVAATLLPALCGAPLPAAQRRLLERCWHEVPPPGRPLYVFALRPRRTHAVRLEMAGWSELPPLVAFLERLRAPAAAARIAALAPLLAAGGRLHLSCDLDHRLESIGPRVGVEVSFSRQPRRDPRWERLLGRLVAAGLCSPAARDAALAWPGQNSVWTAPGRWPLGRDAAALRCVRALSHVKLVCDRRRPLAAKLYLLAAALAQPPG